MEEPTPGQTVTPQVPSSGGADIPTPPTALVPTTAIDNANAAPQTPSPTSVPQAPVAAATSSPSPSQNVADTSAVAASPADEANSPEPNLQASGWQYTAPTDESRPLVSLDTPIEWTASEFIAHEKGLGWYVVLALAGLGVAAADYLLTKDIFSTVIIVFASVAFGAYGSRKPKTQSYRLTNEGLRIGEKQYYFHDFKSFSSTKDGAIASLVFMPLKRFMPPLTVYVAPDMEEQVTDFLSAILPFEEHKPDAVDSLLRRIRF